jgi:hypothetical protein
MYLTPEQYSHNGSKGLNYHKLKNPFLCTPDKHNVNHMTFYILKRKMQLMCYAEFENCRSNPKGTQAHTYKKIHFLDVKIIKHIHRNL